MLRFAFLYSISSEKNIFSFTPSEPGLVHTYNSIKANIAVAGFFVNQARQSSHSFPSYKEEEAALIYNYPSKFIGGSEKSEYTFQVPYLIPFF